MIWLDVFVLVPLKKTPPKDQFISDSALTTPRTPSISSYRSSNTGRDRASSRRGSSRASSERGGGGTVGRRKGSDNPQNNSPRVIELEDDPDDFAELNRTNSLMKEIQKKVG